MRETRRLNCMTKDPAGHLQHASWTLDGLEGRYECEVSAHPGPTKPIGERNCFFLVYCSESADTFPRRTPAHCPSQGHTALLQSVRRKKGEPGPVCAIQDSLPCGDKVPLPCGQTSEKIRVLHKNETGWICGRGPTVSATESNKHSHDDDHKCMATGNREICRLINPSPQISRSYFMA